MIFLDLTVADDSVASADSPRPIEPSDARPPAAAPRSRELEESWSPEPVVTRTISE